VTEVPTVKIRRASKAFLRSYGEKCTDLDETSSPMTIYIPSKLPFLHGCQGGKQFWKYP